MPKTLAWNIGTTDYCRFCSDPEEEESTSHILCHCKALAGKRLNCLGKEEFNDLDDLSTAKISGLDKFCRAFEMI